MSIRVDVEDLGRFVAAYEWAFLVSSGTDRPQIEAQRVVWRDGSLHLVGVGQTTLANITRKAKVTLVWPPSPAAVAANPDIPEGFTLLVDGSAAIVARAKRTAIAVRPTSAVYHRPAPAWPG